MNTATDALRGARKSEDEFKIPRERCSRYCFGVRTGFEDGEMKQHKGAMVVVILS
jgi:hypothetical protein